MAHNRCRQGRTRRWPLALAQIASKTILLVSIAITLGKVIRAQEGSSSQLAALFKTSNFQITTKVFFLMHSQGLFSHQSTIHESYSNELQRARLDLIPLSDEQGETTFFYAAKADKLMAWSAKSGSLDGTRECTRSSQPDLAAKMFSRAAIEHAPNLDDWRQFIPLKDISTKPSPPPSNLASLQDYLIGPARLLLLVEMNRDLLKRETASSRRSPGTDVYLELDRYTLDLPIYAGGGKILKLQVMYLSQLAASNAANQLPYQILIPLTKSDTLLFQYTPARAINQLDPFNDYHMSILNFFSYPIGNGCSSLLKDTSDNGPRISGEAELRLKKLEQRQVVSFEATLNRYEPNAPAMNRRLFVAYDGYAKAIRQDSIDHWSDTYTIQLDDLVFGRKYFIRAGKRGVGWRANKVTLSEMTKTNAECHAMRTLDPKGRKSMLGLSPIVPYTDLVEMGVSYVRGMRAQVYEHESKELPGLIFHKVFLVDKLGRGFALYDPNINSAEQTSAFSIVYYFLAPIASSETTKSNKDSWNQNPSEQLIRLEVYQAGFLLYQIEVFNFRWQLSSAPNGDRQDQLFSLQDRCAETSGEFLDTSETTMPATGLQRRPANLLLLELEYVQSPERLSMRADQVVDAIKNTPVRQKALIRGLMSVADSIYPTQIINIKSRVKHDPMKRGESKTIMDNVRDLKRIRILASLELAHVNGPPKREYTIVAVGRGRFEVPYQEFSEYGLFPAKFDALTFAGCFLEAAELHSRAELAASDADTTILFAFCNSFCQIDNKAVKRATGGASGQVDYESGVFKFLSANGEANVGAGESVCEIMELRVGAPGDGGGSQEEIKSWAEIQARLRDRIVSLRLNDVAKSRGSVGADRDRIDALDFRISRVEMNSLRGELLHDSLSTNDQSSHLAGLGFVPNESLGFQLVDLAGDVNHNFDGLSDDGVGRTTVSADACHANCVANFECKSYSTCLLDSSEIECIVSPVDLHNRPLMKSIKDSASAYKKAHPSRAGSIRIAGRLLLLGANGTSGGPEPGANEAAEQERAAPDMVQFKVNNRCEIRSKRAIELFAGLSLRQKLRPSLESLRPAEDVEQCAETCLSQIQSFFKLTSEDKLELEQGQVKPAEMHDKLIRQMCHFCGSFGFVDLAASSIGYDVLSEIRKMDKFSSTPGLCFIGRPTRLASEASSNGTESGSQPKPETAGTTNAEGLFDDKQISFEMEMFSFRYLNLYKRHSGVRLLGSQVRRADTSLAEQEQAANIEQQELVARLNRQSVFDHRTAETCAEICFSQGVQWCRSFDFIEQKMAGKHVAKPYCVFNSITMVEARLASSGGAASLIAANHVDLIEENRVVDATDGEPTGVMQEKSLIYHHYEPREAYSMDNVVLKALNEHGDYSSSSPPVNLTHWRSTVLPTLALVFICLVGSISGFIAAILVTRRCNSEKQLESRLDRAASSLGLGPISRRGPLVSDDEFVH